MPDRILMTADTVGGVWTFALELASSLSHAGVKIILAAIGPTISAEQRDEAARISRLTLHHGAYRLEWMGEPWKDVEESGRWLAALEDRYAPDIVHLNTYGHGAVPWRAPVVLTAHSCVLSWWSAVKHEPAPAEWDRYRDAVERSLACASIVTAPSNWMLGELSRHYSNRPRASRAIWNGRSAPYFHPRPKEPFVLCAGRLWDEAKNAAALARAAERIAWPVYLAGDSAHPFSSCRMLGRLSPDALASWYGRAAIYAQPARYEPFGLSILEAALAGCALVLGDTPSLREIWGDAAVFVAPDDGPALAKAIGRLIRNDPERRLLVRRSLGRSRLYTPARMAAEYLDVYRLTEEKRRLAFAS